MTTLLIIGATGLVGGEVLKQALLDARISRVIAPTRRPLQPHPKLVNPVVEFDALPLNTAWWQGVDAAICAIGTTRKQTKSQVEYHKIDVEYPVAIATILSKHGTRAFVMTTSTGASLTSPFSYLKMKGEVEDELKKIGFSSLTIVRPSFLAGHRNQPRFGEGVALFFYRIIQLVLPKRARPIAAARVARRLLESAVNAPAGVNIVESEAL